MAWNDAARVVMAGRGTAWHGRDSRNEKGKMKNQYPFDLSKFSKGDRIDRAAVEVAFGVRADTKGFRVALLRLRCYLEEDFLDRGEIVTITEDDGALMILTDVEAAVFNDEAVWGFVRRATKALARQRAVDRSKLDADQTKQHDRALEVNGRAIAATHRERSAPTLRAEDRQTPLLK